MTEGRLGTPNKTQDPNGERKPPMRARGVANRAGKSIHSTQIESSISACISGQDEDDAPQERTACSPPTTGKDDKKTHYSSVLVPAKRRRKGLPQGGSC